MFQDKENKGHIMKKIFLVLAFTIATLSNANPMEQQPNNTSHQTQIQTPNTTAANNTEFVKTELEKWQKLHQILNQEIAKHTTSWQKCGKILSSKLTGTAIILAIPVVLGMLLGISTIRRLNAKDGSEILNEATNTSNTLTKKHGSKIVPLFYVLVISIIIPLLCLSFYGLIELITLFGRLIENKPKTAKAALEALMKKWTEIQTSCPQEVQALLHTQHNNFVTENESLKSLNDKDARRIFEGLFKIIAAHAGTPVTW